MVLVTQYSILTFFVLLEILVLEGFVVAFVFFLDGNRIYLEELRRVGGMDEDAGDGYCWGSG